MIGKKAKMEETIITREALRELGEYSCSIPTGTTIGKRWRRNLNAYRKDRVGVPPEWVIGKYVDIGSATDVGIEWSWAVEAPGQPIRGNLS